MQHTRIFSVLSAGFFLAMFCLGAATAGAQCALTVGWEAWEPYQYKDGDTLTGLDIELVAAILQRAGCQVTWQETPWARLLKLLEHGKTQAAMGASKTPEREAYANFSQPYRSETMSLFVRKGDAAKFPFRTLTELAKSSFRIGVTREYYYGDEMAALLADPAFKKQVLEADEDKENYAKLQKNRIDGFLSDPVVTTANLKRAGLLDQFEIHPMPVFSNDVYVMFSKQATTPEQLAAFNQALYAMKADGAYAQILNKYLPK